MKLENWIWLRSRQRVCGDHFRDCDFLDGPTRTQLTGLAILIIRRQDNCLRGTKGEPYVPEYRENYDVTPQPKRQRKEKEAAKKGGSKTVSGKADKKEAKVCAVAGCGKDSGRLYKPTDRGMELAWAEALQADVGRDWCWPGGEPTRDDILGSGSLGLLGEICASHFRKSDLVDGELSAEAVPSLRLPRLKPTSAV